MPLYADAGVEAMIVDWDNAYRSNLDWEADVRRQPQRALGSDGISLPIVWSESIAFQKFQRYAHDELSLERYVAFIADAVAEGRGALMLYANDAEIFDHRPGRFAAEPALGQGEWERVARALRTLGEAGIGTPALPRDVLALLDRPGAGRELRLEAPDQPIPVKKQDKYNITRWAVTGRDDVGINTRCQRIYERLRTTAVEDPAPWRRLCELWASDYRTHITDDRWEAMLGELARAEADAGVAPVAPAPRLPRGRRRRRAARGGHARGVAVARAQRPPRRHAQRPPRARDRGLLRSAARSRHALRNARARLLSVDRARRRLVHRRRRPGGAAAPQGHRPRADEARLRTLGRRRDPRLRAPDD